MLETPGTAGRETGLILYEHFEGRPPRLYPIRAQHLVAQKSRTYSLVVTPLTIHTTVFGSCWTRCVFF